MIQKNQGVRNEGPTVAVVCPTTISVARPPANRQRFYMLRSRGKVKLPVAILRKLLE